MSASRFETFREVAARPFPLEQVRLLDGPLKEKQDLHGRRLLAWDPDRLLHMFRVTAGLPSGAEPLGGWERPDCELRGHSMGHYLSGLALMFASTGDRRFQKRAERIVGELAKCQAAAPSQGFGEGYLCAFPESLFEKVDRCQPVWAPWYTCHKIMAGLLDVHLHGRGRQALDVLLKLTDWADRRTAALSWEHVQRTLDLEFGGMEEALLNVYAVTRDPRHLALARRFEHRKVMDPLARGLDPLQHLHANTQIPKFVGAARAWELTGNEYARDAATNAWGFVALHRSYCCGGHGNYEAFRTPQDVLAAELSPDTQETCNTYNMLKLTRALFGWKAEPRYADFHERAFLNHILATQHPAEGQVMYFLSLEPGHFKVFDTPNDSFWCCTGTGMESFSKLGDSLYFHSDDALWVNLFFASEATWKAKGVVVLQETTFPEEEGTTLTIRAAQPAAFTLHVRVPSWAEGAVVRVNGRTVGGAAAPPGYVSLARTWKDGDRVKVSLPMKLFLDRMPDNPNLAAVRYGPLVLAGELGTAQFAPEQQFQKDPRAMDGAPRVPVPEFVGVTADPSDWIERVPGKPLTFRTRGVGRPADVTLIPLNRLYDQRYNVYWRLKP
jgi:DUF1680 family protein